MKNDEISDYGDGVTEYKSKPVPRWLSYSYWFWLAVGLFWLVYYINGSRGILDRGHWHQLERAAATTFPLESSDRPYPAPDPIKDSPYEDPLPSYN